MLISNDNNQKSPAPFLQDGHSAQILLELLPAFLDQLFTFLNASVYKAYTWGWLDMR
jgi:hypothetical protein